MQNRLPTIFAVGVHSPLLAQPLISNYRIEAHRSGRKEMIRHLYNALRKHPSSASEIN